MSKRASKSVKRCFISDCGSDKENQSCDSQLMSHRFTPKGILLAWQSVIPKPGLTLNSTICARHFLPEDIIKTRLIGNVEYPYKNWTLKKDAIPKLHLGGVGRIRLPVREKKTKNKTNPGKLNIKNMVVNLMFYIFLCLTYLRHSNWRRMCL